MTSNERFDNDDGKIGARRLELLRNRHKEIPIEERQAMNSYFNTSICIVRIM